MTGIPQAVEQHARALGEEVGLTEEQVQTLIKGVLEARRQFGVGQAVRAGDVGFSKLYDDDKLEALIEHGKAFITHWEAANQAWSSFLEDVRVLPLYDGAEAAERLPKLPDLELLWVEEFIERAETARWAGRGKRKRGRPLTLEQHGFVRALNAAHEDVYGSPLPKSSKGAEWVYGWYEALGFESPEDDAMIRRALRKAPLRSKMIRL